MDDKQNYVANIMLSLTVSYPNMDIRGIPLIQQAIAECYDRGFTVEDAIKYMRCVEEVNPSLNEDVALKRMAEINKKYPQDLTAQKEL